MAQPMHGIRLVPVNPPQTEMDVDIIAIHGLDTTSPETWTWQDPKKQKPSVNWLKDPTMLPTRVQKAQIFTCDWPASLFKESTSIEMTITELARTLLVTIQSKRAELGVEENRPILFIASCLGGIILIQSPVLAARHGSEYASLWKATGGVVFLATPFRGTAFQDIASWSVFLKSYASFTDRVVTELLDTVKASTRFLEDLVADFTWRCRRREQRDSRDPPCLLASFYETEKGNLLRKGPLLKWVANYLYEEKPVSLLA
jgi:hypothetical protein